MIRGRSSAWFRSSPGLLGALLAALLVGAIGKAQDDSRATEYTRREWHLQDGLPSEEITQVMQDRRGYLWVGTTGGLARFDGSQFQPVSLPRPAGTRGVIYVRAIVESRTLGLVVAPNLGGAWVLATDEPPRPAPFAAALEGKAVLSLFAEDDGTVWAVRSDETVVRYDGRGTQTFAVPSRLPGARWIGFATDGRKRLWVTSGADLFRYENGELVPQRHDFGGEELRIVSSRGDGPWVVTERQLMRVGTEQPPAPVALPALLGAHYVQALLEDARGVVWLGTRSRGLHWIADGRVTHVAGSHDDIYSIGEDREGNVWVGANGAGLHRLRPKTYRIYDKSAGLLLDFSPTVCEDRDGNMWFANRDGGVVRLRDGVIKRFPQLPGWPSYSAVSVFPWRDGGVGFSCGPGLYRAGAPDDDTLRRIEEVPVLPIVRDTLVARNGDTWMSVSPDRIGRLRDGAFREFGPADGFPPEDVRSIAEDAAGRVVVGTLGGKVLRFDGQRFAAVDLGAQAKGAAVQAIHVEPDGTLWLGTEGDGLVLVRGGQVAVITTRHGLPHADVTQIIADDRGHLWFGSRGGVFRVSRSELIDCADGRMARLHPILVGKDDGLKELTCLGLFQPGVWKSRDGKLWFATRRGVLAIDPAVQVAAPTPPPVEITGVRSDGLETAPTGEVRIGAAVRKLEIAFSVLCLATPERVQARYRLDGFDADWVLAGGPLVATYPRLPPGQYRFRVQASIGDGAVNETGDTLVFDVEPQWWQTLWFRAGAGALALLIVTLAVRAWSHRRLRRRLEALERASAVERERTRIAQNIHDDVGASLTRISLLTQSAQNATAGAPQFEQIYDTVSEITRAMDEIVWAVNPKYDDLDSLAYYLGNFAQNFLRTAGIRCRLDMPERLPPATLTSQLRHHLFLCCKEALNNVVKHAGATAVTVRLAVAADSLSIVIADDGRGIDPAGAALHPDRALSGHGLPGMHRRMAEAGGACSVAAGPDGGTIVTLRVPVTVPRGVTSP